MKRNLDLIYRKLFENFGPQRWWPADTRFEVMVGAILTQNTSWSNVEKAIINLKKAGVLSLPKLNRLSHSKLAQLIRPAGYYNIKARRLKNFLQFLSVSYGGSFKNMLCQDTEILRQELLSVNGIGPETADSMLLYALDKPVFVVDAYTKRIFSRHGIVKSDSDYQAVQKLFMQKLKNNVKLFNEYHALIVRLGKDYCLKRKPRCQICPLNI